jgi:peptidoglycan/xylan/chitin deacetylase (PgdA/CDA1 family)
MRSLKILNVLWHSVEPDSINPAFLTGANPTVSQFRKQIEFLVDRYTPISIREFLDLTENRTLLRSYKKPPVLLSFDDGFKNVVDQALPVLNEFGTPALFFVLGEVIKDPDFVPWYVERIHLVRKTSKRHVTFANTSVDLTSRAGYRTLTDLFYDSFTTCPAGDRPKLMENLAESLEVDRPNASDLDSDLRFLGRDDLVKLGSTSLLTVGSHAMTHRFLDSLSYDEQFYELQQSHLLLSGCSPSYFPTLAYPGGAFNADTVAIAKQIYKCAFATFALSFGGSYRNTYTYPRVMIGQETSQGLAYAVNQRRLTYFLPLKRILQTARKWRTV